MIACRLNPGPATVRSVAVAGLLVFAGCRANHATTSGEPHMAGERPSVTVRILPASTEQRPGAVEMADEEGRVFYVGADPIVTEGDIVAARCEPDRSDRNSIIITLSDDCAKRLSKFTSAHLGEYLAILVDNELASVARIQSSVSRTAVITGSFTQARAEQIAEALNGR